MGLETPLQDAVLNWFRGQSFPLPPTVLWLSIHRGESLDSADEASALIGGRIETAMTVWQTPRTSSGEPLPHVGPFIPAADGPREITNLVQLKRGLAAEDLVITGFGLWSAETGGIQWMSGRLQEPGYALAGDVPAFAPGSILLRPCV